MAQPVIQTSFNSGEWSPALNARVDLTKYHSGAALLRNFFIDYRGGATTRPGTKYILQCYKSATAVRLIPFQASFTVSYILEFGDLYIRFFNNGSPVLEAPIAITAATQANPAVLSIANTWSVGDWIYLAGIGGMTQLNGNYYRINARTAGTVTLGDLSGNNINSTTYGAYISGGTAARIYTLASPYTASELAQIKFAQNVNALFLCHPNHPPYQLTLITATNWTLAAITFGSTIAVPTGQAVTSTLPASTYNYAYVVTAVDANGQESGPSGYAAIANLADLRNTGGTNTVTWTAVTGAASYNVYKAEIRVGAAVPVGAAFGFAGNCTALTFIDSNIGPDFSQGPPVVQNPFFGTGVQSLTITAPGTYSGGDPVPIISFSGGGGAGAAAQATLQCTAVASIVNGGAGYVVGESFLVQGNSGGLILAVTSITGIGGAVSGLSITIPGNVTSGVLPSAPQAMVAIPGEGVGCTFNLTWGVSAGNITSPGTGYGPAPAVAFSGGGATAIATLGTPSSGNPTVPNFFQQRFVLAGPVSNAQQFNFSQPGSYYNFNVNNPLEDDDAIQGSLVSGRLNTIKALVSMPSGLAVLTDQQAWLINGGSAGSGITPTTIVANAQAYNGASDVPPIVANYDILYVQAKGSIVRDLSYNFYTNVYTGADISVLSSHLFYGFTILEWAWAEEPFKVVWAVRNDGNLLSLTFLKDQELIAWAHSDTQGAFKSIATVTETVASGAVDAIYTVVQRTTALGLVQYIERLTELYYPTGSTDAWNVDAGLQYNGSSVLTFSGASHLGGLSVTGLATDNTGQVTVIPTFTMPLSGIFTLAAPTLPATGYTRVTVGLAYTPQLQTLGLDLGEPTVQGKRKKIVAVTVRCENTLGLQIGSDFDNLVSMKDLALGNVGSATNEVVTGLVTGDARTIIDPKWTVPGQYCIQQPLPYPASILGVIPEIVVGDTK